MSMMGNELSRKKKASRKRSNSSSSSSSSNSTTITSSSSSSSVSSHQTKFGDSVIIAYGASNEYEQIHRGNSSNFHAPFNTMYDSTHPNFNLQQGVNDTGHTIMDVKTGSYHNLIVTDKGSVYGAGWSTYGQYHRSKETTYFSRTTKDYIVKKIFTKFNFSVFILEDGKAIAGGWNGYSVIAGSLTQDGATSVVHILPERRFKTAGCGGSHLILIDVDDNCYCSGWNQYGQLALGSTDSVSVPQLMPPVMWNNERVKFVSIDGGYAHTLFLDSTGAVWAAGKNNSGQLCLGRTSEYEDKPVRIDPKLYNNSRIIQICCGEEHSGFLTEFGDCYLSGSNTRMYFILNPTMSLTSLPR
jgi:alpha-tubulin suppressor-like RCC1 family protein